MRAAVAVALVMSLAGCSLLGPAESIATSDIATILTNPSAFDGKLIRVQGAAVVRFEASFICPAPGTLDPPGGSKNCLSLVPGESDTETYDIRQLDGKTVEIAGRFNFKSFGHMGAYGGSIAVTPGLITGTHNMGVAPLPPPLPGLSANNSFKPTPLRGAAYFQS